LTLTPTRQTGFIVRLQSQGGDGGEATESKRARQHYRLSEPANHGRGARMFTESLADAGRKSTSSALRATASRSANASAPRSGAVSLAPPRSAVSLASRPGADAAPPARSPPWSSEPYGATYACPRPSNASGLDLALGEARGTGGSAGFGLRDRSVTPSAKQLMNRSGDLHFRGASEQLCKQRVPGKRAG